APGSRRRDYPAGSSAAEALRERLRGRSAAGSASNGGRRTPPLRTATRAAALERFPRSRHLRELSAGDAAGERDPAMGGSLRPGFPADPGGVAEAARRKRKGLAGSLGNERRPGVAPGGRQRQRQRGAARGEFPARRRE